MKRLLALGMLMMVAMPVFAEVPKLINYSGKIVDKQGYVVPDGDYDMIFALWDAASGGNKVWEEEHFTTRGQGVHTTAGGFNVVLGSIDPAGKPLPAFDKNYFVAMTFKKDAASPWESFGRQEIVSVPYAIRANDGIPKGGILTWTGTSCPAGYTRLSQFDGMFPRGADSYGNTGGADAHNHSATISDNGTHSHTYVGTTAANTMAPAEQNIANNTTGAAPIYHSHAMNITTNPNGLHSHTATLPSQANVPKYFNVIFCLKQ